MSERWLASTICAGRSGALHSLLARSMRAGYCAEENWLISEGIERRLIIVGEVLARLRHHHPAVFARIPDEPQAIALRNVIVHQYDYVDNRIIWQTVNASLSIVAEQVNALDVEGREDAKA